MTRSQRDWHLRLWWVIGPAVVIGIVVAIGARADRSTRSSLTPTARAIIEGKDRR